MSPGNLDPSDAERVEEELPPPLPAVASAFFSHYLFKLFFRQRSGPAATATSERGA